LLPIGAGDEGKGPVDHHTGNGLKDWPQHPGFSAAEIIAMNGVVIAAGIKTGGGFCAVDIDGATAVAWLEARGLNPREAPTWRVFRTTDPNRFKVIFRLTPDQAAALGELKTSVQTKPPVKEQQPDGSWKVLVKGEAVEIYHQGGSQVVVIGAHLSSGGAYGSPEGGGPGAIDAPDEGWMAGLLAVRDEAARLRTTGDPSRPRKPPAGGKWKASGHRSPCPICGRDTSSACGSSTAADGAEFANCYQGSTFYPPTGLKVGDTITGNDGRTWAFLKEYKVEAMGWKSEFKIHTPLPEPIPPADLWPAPLPVATTVASTTSPVITTAAQKLEMLRAEADRIFANKEIQPSDRLFYMRDYAEGRLALFPRDNELLRLIWEARRRAAGVVDIIKPGDKLSRVEQPWLWQGVVLASTLNLVIAMPKVGKTSMMLEFFSCWHKGCDQLFGMPFHGDPPKILIVGTDQPESDWTRMMAHAGLITDEDELKPFIVGLATAERPIHLDSEGISKIAEYAQQYPGLLILVDSYHGCTRSLGLKDKDADYAEPMLDLQEAVSPHKATVIIIHHSGKTNANEGPVMASRGGTALPAAASQLIALNKMPKENPLAADDRRVIVKTEGRAGNSIDLLIEHVESSGEWVCHGTAEEVERQQYLAKAEGSLGEVQEDCLTIVREEWAAKRTPSTVHEVWKLRAKGDESSIRRALKKLATLGLLDRIVGGEQVEGRGRPGDLYRPAGAAAGPTYSGPDPFSDSRQVFPESEYLNPLLPFNPGEEGNKGFSGIKDASGGNRGALPVNGQPSAVQTVTDLITAAMEDLRIDHTTADAVGLLHAHLAGHGISRTQIALALDQLKADDQPDQQELVY